MAKKTRTDWLDEGLLILGEYGVRGLTIDRLCRNLERTKGSFYHHFKNAQDFTDQLLEHWAEQYKTDPGDLSGDPDELLAFLDRLMRDVFKSITRPEAAIRSLSASSSKAQLLVERIDRQRYDFLLLVFRSLTADESRAAILADTLMAITIGSLAVYPRMDPDRVYELYREFIHQYLGR